MGSTQTKSAKAEGNSVSAAILQPQDLLCTAELSRRIAHPPRLQEENDAYRFLARCLAQEPKQMPQALSDHALLLCKGGSAGVSLLEDQPDGTTLFRWVALSGASAPFIGGSTPRAFSPCGMCLDAGDPILVAHPERCFTYFQQLTFPIVEGLVLPLRTEEQVFGTIWVMSHTPERRFDSEDVRVMAGLADFTAAALRMSDLQRKREHNIAAVERSNHDLELLVTTASNLLTHSEPKNFLQALFDRLSRYCGLDSCFSHRVSGSRLQLLFCTGVPDELCRTIEWLDFGQAVCGTVAETRRCVIAEDIQNSADPLVVIVRSMGIQAYYCHPLIAGGRLLGTLSFGTRKRPRFTDEEIAVLKAVSDQVALVLERYQFVHQLADKNAQLADKNQELARVNEDLTQFAHAVGHDLQEPVRTISAYSQLLARTLGSKLDERERGFLRFVSGASEGLDRLIRSLLAFSRVANNAADMQEVDANQVVGDALLACRALLNESQAEVEVASLPAAILADRSQVAQVFQNLISNAVKYRRQSVTPHIRISGEEHGPEAIFAVADNGEGIAREHQERIFGVFTRLHGRDVPGSGLGLAISKRIVERHGGRLWVESQPGEGTTFRFTVPLAAYDEHS